MRHLALTLLLTSAAFAQSRDGGTPVKTWPRSLVSFEDYKRLMGEVEGWRAQRLINLDAFLEMQRDPKTVVLDARSAFRFERKHLRGAVNLSFSDFTADNLKRLIPDPATRILIYCNNNFDGDQVDFTSKVARPFDASRGPPESQILDNRKPVMLALNVPTFINLYGYGYRNVYELAELVNVNDPRITFEGSVVKPPGRR